MKKRFWFRFWSNGYGICFTHKSKVLFSIRNGYRKSLFILGYYIYILKPMKLTEQNKVELKFVTKLIQKLIGWTLVIGSIILIYLSGDIDKPLLKCEPKVILLTATMIIGIWILIKNNKNGLK